MEIVNTLDSVTKQYIIAYRNRFNPTDEHVRTAIPLNRLNGVISFEERSVLFRVVNYLDSQTNWKILHNIKWRIAKSSKGLENDLPHTHANLIFLPYNFVTLSFESIARMMLHEKIHIYQRLYPIPTVILFKTHWNIVMKRKRTSTAPTARTNPDTNDILYYLYHPLTKSFGYYEATYLPTALTLTDVTYTFVKESVILGHQDTTYFDLIETFKIGQYDHPNEVMACLLTKMAFDDIQHRPTNKWINMYLKQNGISQ